MSLDVSLVAIKPVDVFSANITHNLSQMAKEAGIYECLWRPAESGIKIAVDLIIPLTDAIRLMQDEPERFKKLNAPNDWGTYDEFLPWVIQYRDACLDNPDAKVEVSR